MQFPLLTAKFLFQMLFPHLRSGQRMAFRRPGMLEEYCILFLIVSNDGHYDYYNFKRSYSMSYHHRQLIHGRHLMI